jgi:hypothetical protein
LNIEHGSSSLIAQQTPLQASNQIMSRFLKLVLLLTLWGQAQAFGVNPSSKTLSARSAAARPSKKNLTVRKAALGNYAPAAAALFNNMKLPASIISGAMIPVGILGPLKLEPDDDDGKFAIFLRRIYPFAAILALCSELVSVMWATVAVNQLTETNVAVASSVWDLIQRDFSLPWVATNAHFVLGMIGFIWVICSRAYFMAAKGALGASTAGIAFSSLLLITSIVNRGVAAGGGGGDLRFGGSVLALFRCYVHLLLKRACNLKSFGPLEIASVAVFTLSVVNTFRIVIRDVVSMESKKSSE